MTPQIIDQTAADKKIAYVLDDEEQVGRLVTRMLSSSGYVAAAFTDVAECLQRIKEAPEYSKPSVLLLDLSLGRHDAVEVFDRLKALQFKGRLLLMSGVDDLTINAVQKICISRGFTAYPPLKKPFRLDALRERLGGAPAAPEVDDTQAKSPSAPLERALATGAWALWYQKKIELTSGALCGAELLFYAQHPAYGYVPIADSLSPSDSALFYPKARAVMRQLSADWHKHFASREPRFEFSTKLPFSLVTARGFIQLACELLPADIGFPGLTIEVTDAQLLKRHQDFREVAAQLKLHRISLSIADIGAAYAVVGNGSAFPFNELKLGDDLVSDCALNKVKQSACKGVIDLAHSVGARACAEGVSDVDQLKALMKLGCDMAQGDFIGRAQPVDAFRAAIVPHRAQADGAGCEDEFAWPTLESA